MTYWDTSALLKLYVAEPDSGFFLDLVAHSSGPLLTSDIAREELLCALHRKEAIGNLIANAAPGLYEAFVGDQVAGRIVVIPNSLDVAAEAVRVVEESYKLEPRLLIRSLDVIHVATALSARADTMVATDARLREVSRRLGMSVSPTADS